MWQRILVTGADTRARTQGWDHSIEQVTQRASITNSFLNIGTVVVAVVVWRTRCRGRGRPELTGRVGMGVVLPVVLALAFQAGHSAKEVRVKKRGDQAPDPEPASCHRATDSPASNLGAYLGSLGR